MATQVDDMKKDDAVNTSVGPVLNTTSSASSDYDQNQKVHVHLHDEEGRVIAEGWPAGVDEAKLLRKIDMRLIPWLSFLYLLSFLDRSAIGNARLYGLEAELGLSSTQYAICLTVFFFPYALFEVPSNVLLKRLKPAVWFPTITILVGICMLSQGVVNSYGGLITARFFLGVTEAGLFPGVNYFLTGWYKRNEFGKRSAIFFSAATVSGAFGGLLAFALNKMDGVGGYSGWRWIFIIIGLITFLAGIASIWMCENFPDTAKFLTPEEKRAVVWRLQQDQQFSAAGEGFQWLHVWKAAFDWKTWVGMGAYMGWDCPLYAFSLFTPSIINQLGYTANRANLVSIPIYVVACIFTVTIGFMADRTGKRSLYGVGSGILAIVGYIILIANDPADKPGVSYFACYLAASGIYPMIPNTVAMVGVNTEGSYTRSVVMAIVISWGNIQGAVSSNIYPKRTAPHYIMGHSILLGYLALGVVSSAAWFFIANSKNRKRAAGLNKERILEDEYGSDSGRDLVAEARQAREAERAQLGMVARFFRRLHLSGGGTYATVQEAKSLKGDAWSGFRYES